MLPTDKSSNIILNTINNRLLYNDDKTLIERILPIRGKNQNLYFLSDEKPTEGDWILDIKNPLYPRQIKTKHLLEDLFDSEKKVIATTDESLTITKNVTNPAVQELIGLGYVCSTYEDKLQQPSKEFIQYYIEQYNKRNIIEWVDVEMENKYWDAKTPKYKKLKRPKHITIRKLYECFVQKK